MDIKTFCKRFMLWTAVAVAVVILICGLCFGKVIEGSFFAEVAKWLVMGVVLAGLVCGIFYALVATIVSRKKDKDED